MSNTKQLPARLAQPKPKDFLDELKEANGAVIPDSMEGIDDADAFELMKKANAGQLKQLTGDYWKPTPGEHVFKFMAMTTTDFDGEEQEAVILMDEKGVSWVAGQKVLVNSLKRVTDFPCFCKVIVSEGMIKGSNGSYYPIQVLVFPVSANTKL